MYIIISLICLNFLNFTFAQNNFTTGSNNKQKTESSKVFDEIGKGIAGHEIEAIARYFSPQTYLSLSSGISGYYSSNQAYYVLEDFFKVYRVTAFRFDNIRTDSNNPYATGEYQFEYRGKRDMAQVYIALKKSGNNWKISQITIN
ncbi:MAG TPA: DUF4783 domain-containing protein [Ignavibacteriaceae bacterium]|nr:DUF4783 domain-containing protein [Ignavibacteriaceae bacterium]